eukprot:5325438-Pyramimonas_sp.AAC.1
MEGRSFSKCDSGLSAAHIRFWINCKSVTDCGRAVFKMRLSPQRRAHSLQKLASGSRIKSGSFSKCGSRLSAAHIRFR